VDLHPGFLFPFAIRVQLARDLPKMLPGVVEIDDLNGLGKMQGNKIPNPFGAVTNHDLLECAAPAVSVGFRIDSPAKLFRTLDGSGICGGRAHDGQHRLAALLAIVSLLAAGASQRAPFRADGWDGSSSREERDGRSAVSQLLQFPAPSEERGGTRSGVEPSAGPSRSLPDRCAPSCADPGKAPTRTALLRV
jgi:hypothetical protein